MQLRRDRAELLGLRLEGIVAHVAIAVRERASALERRMGEPGFWDDPEAAAQVSAEHARVTRKLEGFQALNYVRERYVLGNGSDIGRMKRQQAFIAAMAHQVLSANTLARPDRLLKFLDAAHVKDLLALLRFAENPRDRVAGFRLLQLMPGVGPTTAQRVLDCMMEVCDAVGALSSMQVEGHSPDHTRSAY